MSAPRALVFLVLIAVSCSETPDCSYKRLLNHVEQKIATHSLEKIRPVKNWTDATTVFVDLYLFGIMEVNEKLQTISSQTWIQMWWVNEFLTWNTSDFCGIHSITIPRAALWGPDILIEEDSSDAGATKNSQYVVVYHNGWVTTTAAKRLTFTCQLKLSKFPFDKQHCHITFGPMAYEPSAMKLKSRNNETTLSSISTLIMVTRGEWDLDYLDILKDSAFKDNKLIYTLNISRRPLLYVVNFIIPLFYLLILDLASFFISEARGEKISFKVTVLLSISVLLLILKDMLPSTENHLPLIASYCVGIFAMVGLSVLEAMFISFLCDLDFKCCKRTRSSASEPISVEVDAETNKEHGAAEETGGMKMEKLAAPLQAEMLRQVLEEVRACRKEAARQDKPPPRPFKRLAEIIDGVYHVLYLLTILVFLTFICCAWFPFEDPPLDV